MKKLSLHDLKCGSIVDYDTKDEQRGVEYMVINWKHLKIIAEKQDEFNLFYSARILSEYWMGEFGFKPGNGNQYNKWIDEYENTSLFVNAYDEDFDAITVGICINQKHVWTTNRIRYVHELQNLYHSITGIMLTLNDDFQ
jgi:hypothetical protein